MIGDKIRMWRNARGITPEELSEAAGVSLLAIQYYEENKWRPGTGTLVRLADALHVAILDLVEGYKAIYDNGDMLLVENDCGHVKVLGRFPKKDY